MPSARHAPPALLHGAVICAPTGASRVVGLRFGDIADLGCDWGAFAIVLGRELRRPGAAPGDGGTLHVGGGERRVLCRDALQGDGAVALIAHPEAQVAAAAAARVRVEVAGSAPAAAPPDAAKPSTVTARAEVEAADQRGPLWPRAGWRLTLGGIPGADLRVAAAICAWAGLPAAAVALDPAAGAVPNDNAAAALAVAAARATLLALKARLPVRVAAAMGAGR